MDVAETTAARCEPPASVPAGDVQWEAMGASVDHAAVTVSPARLTMIGLQVIRQHGPGRDGRFELPGLVGVAVCDAIFGRSLVDMLFRRRNRRATLAQDARSRVGQGPRSKGFPGVAA